MKVATWNVNGIRARADQLREWLSVEAPDVVFLQELKAAPEKLPEALSGQQEFWARWHGAAAYSGVGLLLRKAAFPNEPQFFHPTFDFETRIVAAPWEDVVFASVYVPNGGKDFAAKLDFMGALAAWTAELRREGRTLLLGGDLNVAREERDVHPKERKPNQIGTRPEERALLQQLLDQGLTDVGRKLDPDNDELFTWWAPWRNLRQRNIGWRIDYLLAGEAIAPRARESAVRREVGTSDHGPVVAWLEDSGAV